MVVWLQLSYRQALLLEYWLVQCKAQPSMQITNQKTKLHNVQVLLGLCLKESGDDAMGWERMYKTKKE